MSEQASNAQTQSSITSNSASFPEKQPFEIRELIFKEALPDNATIRFQVQLKTQSIDVASAAELCSPEHSINDLTAEQKKQLRDSIDITSAPIAVSPFRYETSTAEANAIEARRLRRSRSTRRTPIGIEYLPVYTAEEVEEEEAEIKTRRVSTAQACLILDLAATNSHMRRGAFLALFAHRIPVQIIVDSVLTAQIYAKVLNTIDPKLSASVSYLAITGRSCKWSGLAARK